MRTTCFASALFAAALSLGSGLPQSAAAAPPADPAHEARMAWFRQAKFGLFIHWGLYAIPAGEWKGRPIPGIGEWIMHNTPVPVKEYERLAGGFNPIKFDAEAWVQMAADAGMKYIVITSKHHDGFAMFHSAVTAYNVFDATPFHRDPLKELSVACARHGLRFGFYYSQAQDWHEPGGAGNDWDFPSDSEKDANGAYDRYLRAKAEPQVTELLTAYGPVCLIWFDTPRRMTAERAQRFVNIVHSLQPACLIDGRLGTAGDYVSTHDNTIPSTGEEGDWETPATVNHTWGFKKDDTDWKSPGEIAFKLVDIVSKGGNYLLNVGPTAEGVIPRECQENLRSVGRWLKVNGEAVYGAGRSPFGPEYGEFSIAQKNPDGSRVFLERSDWRCTTKPGRLFFIVFHPSRDGFALPSFQSRIKSIYFLSDATRAPLKLEAVKGVRIVRTPVDLPNPMANVICVEIGDTQVRL